MVGFLRRAPQRGRKRAWPLALLRPCPFPRERSAYVGSGQLNRGAEPSPKELPTPERRRPKQPKKNCANDLDDTFLSTCVAGAGTGSAAGFAHPEHATTKSKIREKRRRRPSAKKGTKVEHAEPPPSPRRKEPPEQQDKAQDEDGAAKDAPPPPPPRSLLPREDVTIIFILGACRLFLRRPTKVKEREKPHPAAPRPTPRNATRWGRRDPYKWPQRGRLASRRGQRRGAHTDSMSVLSARALPSDVHPPNAKGTPPSPLTKTKFLDGRGVPAAAK